MTPKMNLQVQSLKVLATRVVMMKNIDYSTYLTGITKEELDRLDKLEGKYRIQSSKVTIEERYNTMATDCHQITGNTLRGAWEGACSKI